jgi:aryl-alcohol dehydrogenase-like predicted oxidoreductase
MTAGLDRLRRAILLGATLAPIANMTRAASASTPATRPIPKSSEPLPVVGLGTWQVFDVAGEAQATADARAALERFVALGGRVIDSSPMYGSSESVSGELAESLGVGERLFWATKVWISGKDAGIAQMRESMRRLRIPRVDLMQVHNLVDVQTQLATLAQWKRDGLVRYVGVTHYTLSAYAEVERVMRANELDFLQINYSLVERGAAERLLPLAAERRIAVLVNRPFAEGAFFSRVKGKPLPPVAAELGCTTWAQLALKWILGNPAVTCAIPGTRNAKHVEDNMAAATAPLPDEAARAKIAAAFDAL